MSTHAITTTIERQFLDADGDPEVAHPEIEITYRYSPGSPAYTPPGEYGPIDPPESAEIEVISARLIKGDGLSPTPAEVVSWAEDHLATDEGYWELQAYAERNSGPDPDEAYERQRDDGDRERWHHDDF